MIAFVRTRRAAPALALIITATLSACGSDALPTSDATGPTPAVDLPTTDDALDVTPSSLQAIDRAMCQIGPAHPGLSADEVAVMEETALAATGGTIGVTLDHVSSVDGGNGGWTVQMVNDTQFSTATLVRDGSSTVDETTHDLDSMGIDDERLDVLHSWDLSLTDAAASALEVQPGEVMLMTGPLDPVAVLFVIVRTGDDTLVRVALDAVTGDPVNAVVPDLDALAEATMPAPWDGPSVAPGCTPDEDAG